jgi:hypothetical protein
MSRKFSVPRPSGIVVVLCVLYHLGTAKGSCRLQPFITIALYACSERGCKGQ